MGTQLDAERRFEGIIPADLQEQFRHLSYAEMAERPECQDYADELRQLENDWWAAQDAA